MKVKLNGAVHTALKFLEKNESIRGYELAKQVKSVTQSLTLTKFEYETLQYMVEQEWVLKDGDTYSLAAAGKLELIGLNERVVTTQVEKVKHKLHVSDAKSTYMGESMLCPTYRKGAFDYMDCNSIINQKSKPYHLKNP